MSTISSGTTLTTALVQTGDTTGDLVIKTGSSNTTALTISGSNQSVTFAGAVNVASSAFANGSAASPSITFTGDTNTGIFSPGADSIAFAEGGAEIARFDSSGNLGIGTSSPVAKLQSAGGFLATGSTAAFVANAISVDVFSGISRISAAGANNSTQGTLIFNTASADASIFNERMRIGPSGQIGIGGANYGTSGQVLTSAGSGAAPSWQSAQAFSSGTLMLFQQTSAPTGWTKQTTHDNKALRVVSGTASSGGSVGFTTAFASQTPAGSVSINTSGLSAGATTLTTAQMPSHKHDLNKYYRANIFYPVDYGSIANGEGTSAVNSDAIANTGGGGSHSHSISGSATGTFTGTAINLAVSYVDLIIASKD
jgi:hypothetical protein